MCFSCRFKKVLVYRTFSLLCLLVMVWSLPAFASGAPRINLFPQDVRSLLSETQEASRVMESELSEIVAGYQQQIELYNASKCEGSADAGCRQIKGQVADRYKNMLDVMEKHLPVMSRNVEAMTKVMGQTLRSQIGKKMTPFGVQELLNAKERPRVISGRFSLSQRFARYHKLISANSNQTVADLAAEIYLDSNEAGKWMEVILADIQRQKMILDDQSFVFALSDEAIETVESVKSLLFGEDVSSGVPDKGDVRTPSGIDGFVPDLEM